jgi:demethylmenaquinone methyltransferase / 2-methoxy-6-polyprenyl-1,4-benzoquinol methylase
VRFVRLSEIGVGRERVRSASLPHMQDPTYVRNAFARIADRYVLTNHVLSFGIDIWWRKVVTKRIKQLKPRKLLDVATGTGDLALDIQDDVPDCQVIATDFCAEMLEHAKSRGVHETLVADALNLPYGDDEFDMLTVAFGLRNMADYWKALAEMRRVLKPEGRLLILDFSLPEGMMRGPHLFYLRHVMPKIAGLLTGQKDAYEYLCGSIEKFPAGEAMIGLLESCGYKDVTCSPMTFGVVSLYEAGKG